MSSDSSTNEMLAGAAQRLRSALDLLDQAGAPGQIGAWVDHAISALDALTDLGAASSIPHQSAQPVDWL